jgi:MOSC domain-containing protein YiiM
MEFSESVVIRHLLVSPGRNYFGHAPESDTPGDAPTFDLEQVRADAGKGLVGDRNYGARGNLDGQVSFLSADVFDLLRAHVGNPALSPLPARRNIVIAGAPLNQLIGQEFALDFGTHVVRFAGRKHCAPCGWMDRMVAPGALAFLRGRGGLRARVLEGGLLRRGPAQLLTDFRLDLATLTEPLPLPRLPG